MKKYLIIALFVLSCPAISLAQQTLSGADSARMVIDSVLTYARHHSVYRDKVDWAKLTATVKERSAQAKSVQEAMPSVALIYELLGDFHGFAVYNRKYYRWKAPRAPFDTVKYRSLIAKSKQKHKVEAQLLKKGYGYLLIPDNNPTHEHETDTLSQQIQDSLAKLQPEKLKGLIIDLRTNGGGNMYPMILGVANLLGDGQFGSFIDPVTKQKDAWGIKGKATYAGKDTVCRLQRIGKPAIKLKVALLIGPYTASSGEATAITFMGRKNTRLFGNKTAAYTTANQSFQVFNINVLMAVAVEADRNGNTYYGAVSPQQEVNGLDNFENLNRDSKVIAALQWLGAK
ncbi:S41 family peptidase [Mucilaginibacter sp. CSA2-8R]|uniref:S41 family peptidase n=1 Tax=Mucilaginibacter sp. CSA2-8R TaxID=3141542 RepID=UPI00315C84AF